MTFNSLIHPLIFLASASPRRAQLLEQIGVAHRVRPIALDESRRAGEPPAEYVIRLARAKAEALWATLGAAERQPVLGADTTVAIDGDVLGKPADRNEGLEMLERLSGRIHQVFTAVALRHVDGCDHRLSVSEVTFRPLTAAEREAYWQTGEPADKAGGYAVQGLAAVFITRIAGSYSGIMGLPLAETAELLAEIGWRAGGHVAGGTGPRVPTEARV
jgi:septum formation protein